MDKNDEIFSELIFEKAKDLGINNIDKHIVSYLNKDLLEKMKVVLSKATTFLRVSKNKKLSTKELDNAIQTFNFKDFKIEECFQTDKDVIDIAQFANEPLQPVPMKSTAHFHWFAIEGKIPQIATNHLDDNVIEPDITFDNGEYIQIGNSKVVPRISKTLSRELILFLENFEVIFQRDVKLNLLNDDPYVSISKDMEINLIIIQSEPGIVKVFQQLLLLLISNLENEKNIELPKIQMIVLYHIKSILMNKYFDLIPYVSMILKTLLRLLLLDNTSSVLSNNYIAGMIRVKNIALDCLKLLCDATRKKLPFLVSEIVNIIREYIIPNKKIPLYLTSFGVIRIITILGKEQIKEEILPIIEEILNSLKISEIIDAQNKKEIKIKKDEIPYSNNMSCGGNTENSMSFTLPIRAGIDPMLYASLFASGQAHTQQEEKVSETQKTETKLVVGVEEVGKVWDFVNNKGICVYYALLEAVNLVYSTCQNERDVIDRIREVYGENILMSLAKGNKELNFNI